MSIGERIFELRKKHNLTQSELSNSIGVSTAYISQIEGGTRKPSYKVLMYISNKLNASVEYILSGAVADSESGTLDQFISLCLSNLDNNSRDDLINHIFKVGRTKRYEEMPLFTSATEYAQWFINRFKANEVPINIFQIANKLDVNVYHAEISEEGILYKSFDKPVVILDSSAKGNYGRESFTLALLLGHLVLPWHTRSIYSRLKGKKSLDHDEAFEIEARQFAGELILPTAIVKRDFREFELSIASLERLAYEKYQCSMGALAHKYTDIFGEKVAYITSEESTITRLYDTKFQYKLQDRVLEGTKAHSFITNPPKHKETRSGLMDAALWVINAPKGLRIFEESMQDPKHGVTVTLLQIIK